MRALITDNHWIYLENLSPDEEALVVAGFSVQRTQQYVDSSYQGSWDGWYRRYNKRHQRLALPFLAMLRELCAINNLPLAIIDSRPVSTHQPLAYDQITPAFLPKITLDPHQVKSLQIAHSEPMGIYSIPTGGGKTEIIAGLCKLFSCPTLIIADQTVVIDQLKARLELRDVAAKVGLFYAGRRPSGEPIVTGSIQSLIAPKKPPDIPKRADETDKVWAGILRKYDLQLKAYKTRVKNAESLREYAKKAEMLIVDECDKATSESYRYLFSSWFKGHRRYGFSGTPFDDSKPVDRLILQERLGSVLLEETRENLTASKRIIPLDYYMLVIGDNGSIHNRSRYDVAIRDWMIENEKFHQAVRHICQNYPGEGTLVLVNREPLGLALEAELKRHGIKASYIFGKTPPKQRDEALRAFERRELDVLIGGKIIDRGLDLSGGCENLIIATGGKLESDFVQRIGRAVRHNRRGKSRVFDFYFRCNRHLYNHSKSRLQIMVKFNYKTTILYRGITIDGSALIKRRFRLPEPSKT